MYMMIKPNVFRHNCLSPCFPTERVVVIRYGFSAEPLIWCPWSESPNLACLHRWKLGWLPLLARAACPGPIAPCGWDYFILHAAVVALVDRLKLSAAVSAALVCAPLVHGIAPRAFKAPIHASCARQASHPEPCALGNWRKTANPMGTVAWHGMFSWKGTRAGIPNW